MRDKIDRLVTLFSNFDKDLVTSITYITNAQTDKNFLDESELKLISFIKQVISDSEDSEEEEPQFRSRLVSKITEYLSEIGNRNEILESFIYKLFLLSKEKEKLASKEKELQLSTTCLYNPKVIIYFITAPHEEADRGDTDYVQSVITGINEVVNGKFKLRYITGKSRLPSNDQELYNLQALDAEGKNTLLNPKVYNDFANPLRQKAIANIEEYIKQTDQKAEFKILHLQLRAPETGCMIHPQDLERFKYESTVSKIAITCHEWMYYVTSAESTEREGERKDRILDLRTQLSYFQQADWVMFLNEKDKNHAVQVVNSRKLLEEEIDWQGTTDFSSICSVSNVVPTLPTKLELDMLKTENLLRRPPNILIFGLIRSGKGFEEGIELAKLIKNHPELKDSKVYIAGKPQDLKLTKKILREKWGDNDPKLFEQGVLYQEHIERYKKDYAFDLVSKVIIKYLRKLETDQYNEIQNEIKNMLTLEKNKKAQVVKEIINILPASGDRDKKTLRQELCAALTKARQFRMPKQITDEIDRIMVLSKYEELKKQSFEDALPIEVYLSINSELLDSLSQTCKYCVKLEKKGLANNSSSIINALCRKLIIFSNKGGATSEEFLEEGGRYSDAVVLPSTTEKFESQEVFDLILERERDTDQAMNRRTLERMQLSLEELFNNKKIGKDHVEMYLHLKSSSKSSGVISK